MKGVRVLMTYAEKVLDEIEKGNYEEARKHFGWSLRKDSDDMIYSLAEELYSLGTLIDGREIGQIHTGSKYGGS